MGLGASLIACGARLPTTPAVTPITALPFELHDAMPAFFEFWTKAEGRSLSEQTALFRSEVIAPFPELYTKEVLGHDVDTDAGLDRRLATWLPTLPSIVPKMREIHASFRDDVARGVDRFRKTFPDFSWAGDCYVFASTDGMNGGTREVRGRTALLFGLDVSARKTESMPTSVLFAHELFHIHQSAVLPPRDGQRELYCGLWSEGLAEYVSTVIVPGTSDRQALPFSHVHDPAHPALDIPERRVMLDVVMPGLAPTLGAELEQALDSQDEADYAKFFLGRAAPGLGERPVRSGYWFGLKIARAIATGKNLDALARAPASSLRTEIGAALHALIRSA